MAQHLFQTLCVQDFISRLPWKGLRGQVDPARSKVAALDAEMVALYDRESLDMLWKVDGLVGMGTLAWAPSGYHIITGHPGTGTAKVPGRERQPLRGFTSRRSLGRLMRTPAVFRALQLAMLWKVKHDSMARSSARSALRCGRWARWSRT